MRGDLLGAGPIRPTLIDGHERRLGAVRQTVGTKRAVAGPLRRRCGGHDRVGELEGEFGAICHRSSVIRYPLSVAPCI